jgi:hypothetical protein
VSYTLEILPSSVLVSPYCLICTLASSFIEQICHLVVPNVRDLMVCNSMFLQLCLSGRKTSSIRFHVLPVSNNSGKCVLIPRRMK